jgi:hypothetical protein
MQTFHYSIHKIELLDDFFSCEAYGRLSSIINDVKISPLIDEKHDHLLIISFKNHMNGSISI